ncbi:timeless protein-domain-containing protein [Cyathus striatus]|nr:timeless protein-domain-containing protein [Cyathus striatus]
MDDEELIDISSDESDNQAAFDRRALLAPVVTRVVDALGGNETGEYRMGDEVTGCLRDLKKLWRKDETDDERTVARRGLVEDKPMTWPIDMSEELKELDEELDKGTDYTQLMESHLHYKAALLKPGVMDAFFGIMLPPLAKGRRERTERDGQIVNVILHLIRNLAFIKDLSTNSRASADQVEFSSLQSRFIKIMSESRTIQLLLTIAANADNDPLFSTWNTLVLEILYLLFRGAKPTLLATNQVKQPTETLHRLLAQEERFKRDLARKSSTRHSRFGTTISVKLNPSKKHAQTNEDRGNEADTEQVPNSNKSLVLHRQQAINREAGSILDMSKHRKGKKGNTVDELTRDDNLSLEARTVLQNLATDFVEACFNPFLSALLKDIRSERAKITEKDNLRLLFVTKWFLEFFLAMRANEQGKGEQTDRWSFTLVGEVTERSWIAWVLKRMRAAVDEKPKLWTELQAGIECLTQLLLLIDKMSQTDISDPTLSEAADIIRHQLIYNGEVLDIAYDSLRAYKEGTQSLVYLDASVHLAYALLRMLERWGKGKGGDMYVRKKTTKRKKKGKVMDEESGIPDVEEVEEDDEEVIHETMFTFEAFEMRFANSEITQTLLTYLARYREFSSSENMRRVVSLLHRQAVRVKAEGLFFQVSTLDLFKSILDDQKSLPREQPYKDLVNLINFILRKFFKALAEDTFLAIEAFFPKNRGHWKQYSSYEPEQKAQREKNVAENTRFPPDIKVKKGYSWSDQIGIAIAALVDEGQIALVQWTKELLESAIDQRRRIIGEIDKRDAIDELDEDDRDAIFRQQQPSAEAMEKITDYLIPYLDDEHAEAATKNPRLKLLFRLCKFSVLDEDVDEFEWYIPRAIAPSDMHDTVMVISQFLEKPIDLEGKKATDLLSKNRRRARRRSPSPNSDPDIPEKRARQKKDKEKQQYKSAQFIEDSDEEYGDIEAFLAKEKSLREKAAATAAATSGRPSMMKSAGTKKRRKKGGEGGVKKKRKADGSSAADNTAEEFGGEDKESSNSDSDISGTSPAGPTPSSKSMNERPEAEPPKPAPRPKPRPIRRMLSSQSSPPSEPPSELSDGGKNPALPNDSLDDVHPAPRAGTSRSKRLILSSDEDD